MGTKTYTLTIKKGYAHTIIEKLMLDEAIECIPDIIPQWQMIESRRRLAEMKSNPASNIDSDTFFKSIDDNAE
jgi:hypothetical protein